MSTLTDIQRNFIPHILEHVYVSEAARKCGVSEETAFRWMQDPSFRYELECQRRIMARNVMHSLEKHAYKAVETIIEMMHNDKPDAIRLKAADLFLTHARESRRVYGIESKIEELEDMAQRATINHG